MTGRLLGRAWNFLKGPAKTYGGYPVLST
jgi:hypothetical protein